MTRAWPLAALFVLVAVVPAAGAAERSPYLIVLGVAQDGGAPQAG